MNQPNHDDRHKPPGNLGSFRDLVAKVIRVPKEEVDKREAEYQREQAKKPKRGPKPPQ